MPSKQIVCLAFSRKHGGSCFAGIDIATGQWIRAIGIHPHGTLADNDCFMQDAMGKFILPSVLDVLEIDLAEAEPMPAQPENWKIAGSPWKKLRNAESADLEVIRQHIADHAELFRGFDPYVSKQDMETSPPTHSLALIRPQTLSWHPEIDRYGRKRFRGTFSLSGATYSLPLTDDRYATRLAAEPSINRPPNASTDRLLTISLGDLLDETGRYYKLIAGVVELAKR